MQCNLENWIILYGHWGPPMAPFICRLIVMPHSSSHANANLIKGISTASMNNGGCPLLMPVSSSNISWCCVYLQTNPVCCLHLHIDHFPWAKGVVLNRVHSGNTPSQSQPRVSPGGLALCHEKCLNAWLPSLSSLFSFILLTVSQWCI